MTEATSPDVATRPIPVPDHDTNPFWDACRDHELRAQVCTKCGRFRWPPQPFCPDCHSWDYEWQRLSGQGRVESFTVVHYAASPAFKDEVPYVVAVITMEGTDDRVQIVSNVVGCPWEAVAVGMPVEVRFTDVSPEATLPQFQRRSGEVGR